MVDLSRTAIVSLARGSQLVMIECASSHFLLVTEAAADRKTVTAYDYTKRRAMTELVLEDSPVINQIDYDSKQKLLFTQVSTGVGDDPKPRVRIYRQKEMKVELVKEFSDATCFWHNRPARRLLIGELLGTVQSVDAMTGEKKAEATFPNTINSIVADALGDRAVVQCGGKSLFSVGDSSLEDPKKWELPEGSKNDDWLVTNPAVLVGYSTSALKSETIVYSRTGSEAGRLVRKASYSNGTKLSPNYRPRSQFGQSQVEVWSIPASCQNAGVTHHPAGGQGWPAVSSPPSGESSQKSRTG